MQPPWGRWVGGLNHWQEAVVFTAGVPAEFVHASVCLVCLCRCQPVGLSVWYVMPISVHLYASVTGMLCVCLHLQSRLAIGPCQTHHVQGFASHLLHCVKFTSQASRNYTWHFYRAREVFKTANKRDVYQREYYSTKLKITEVTNEVEKERKLMQCVAMF